MDRSDRGVRMSVSLSLLSVGSGSVTPVAPVPGGVLTGGPGAGGLTWTGKVKVTVALTGRSTVVARPPVPLTGPVTTPPPLLAVATQLAAVTPAGSASDTLAPVTALGPALLTTIA